MAENVLSVVVSVLDMLVSFLGILEELTELRVSLTKIQAELRKIQAELRKIQAELCDAEDRQVIDVSVRICLEKINDELGEFGHMLRQKAEIQNQMKTKTVNYSLSIPEVRARANLDVVNHLATPQIDANNSNGSSRSKWWNIGEEFLSFNSTKWVKKARGTLIIVATVFTIMTFRSALNPPGGVWQNNEHKVHGFTCSQDNMCVIGTAVLAYLQVSPTKPIHYTFDDFLYFNTVTFLASLSVILLLISGFPLHNKLGMWLLTIVMCIALTLFVLTYLVGMTMVAGHHNDKYVQSD